MKYLLFIAFGGAFGAVSRYLLTSWVAGLGEGKLPLGTLPLGTLLVNMLGSFAIGIFFISIFVIDIFCY